MDQVFLLKLVLSFFSGAALVCVVTLLSERIGTKLGGIAAGMPTTIVLAAVFIAWTQDTQAAVQATRAMLIGIAAVFGFLFTYFFASKRFERSFTIPISAALLVWLLIAIPGTRYMPHIFASSVIVIFFSLPVFYFILLKQKPSPQEKKPRAGIQELLLRGLLGGSVVSMAVIIAKLVSASYGGAFGAFPAVLTSSFAILHFKHGSQFVREFMRTVPLGTFSLFIFAISANRFYPVQGVAFGTVIAYVLSLLSLAILYKLVIRGQLTGKI